MKIKKTMIERLIKESFEKILKESEFDLFKIGKPAIKMPASSENEHLPFARRVLQKYRDAYPDVMVFSDISFIEFLLKTGKVNSMDDIHDLQMMMNVLKKEKEEKQKKDEKEKRGITGAGRMMFEKRKKR